MANRPSVPEIITVNSEALQSIIRDLLPSQNGFGSELQASNVITPIIDLTAAAEGSTTPISMQQASAFGSNTAFSVSNTTSTLINQTGFWRLVGTINHAALAAGAVDSELILTDGLSVKKFFRVRTGPLVDQYLAVPFDLIVFVAPGEEVQANTTQATSYINGSYRQVADGYGTLVNPNGFPI